MVRRAAICGKTLNVASDRVEKPWTINNIDQSFTTLIQRFTTDS